MPFGEIVCGSPGSGKSTYCHGKHQLLTALHRPIAIVNLDPANDTLPYPCAVDISDLISLKDVMKEYGLGPNGGLLYCMEYLEANFDWLEERLRELGKDGEYVLFDLPGQVELSTNHESVRRVVEMLGKRCAFRVRSVPLSLALCRVASIASVAWSCIASVASVTSTESTASRLWLSAVHLCDAHYVTDAAKYVSVLLLSLRTMLHLELPHVNVLSKIDLLSQYGDLDFNLDFYTEVQDLSYLEHALNAATGGPRFAALNMAMISLVEDYSLVGFETLAVEDKSSMLHLTHAIDRATGYVFVPPPTSTSSSSPNAPPGTVPPTSSSASERPNEYALFSSAAGPIPGTGGDVRDVQERWLDAREEWDAFERKGWREEGEAVRDEAARVRAAEAGVEEESKRAEKDAAVSDGSMAGAGAGARVGKIQIRERNVKPPEDVEMK
ncbi:hypothetical protein K438DRAFT_1961629 [Mycena galopus ATCC 62051]|nr:hypothetical protein K438DRAFT_1961629 [Mycena galopus ATCC 62051]